MSRRSRRRRRLRSGFLGHEIQAAKAGLETNLGLTLVAAKRPVQRFTLSAAAESASAAPISATAAK